MAVINLYLSFYADTVMPGRHRDAIFVYNHKMWRPHYRQCD